MKEHHDTDAVGRPPERKFYGVMVLKAQDGIASERAVLPPEFRMDLKGVDASGLRQDLNPGPRRAESSWTGWRAHPTELHRLVSGF